VQANLGAVRANPHVRLLNLKSAVSTIGTTISIGKDVRANVKITIFLINGVIVSVCIEDTILHNSLG
jgi:hypothetical protein